MDNKFKKIVPFLIILLTIFFIFGSYILYKNEIVNIKEYSYNRINHSLYHFKEYFSISESFLFAMKYTIEDKLNNHCPCNHPKYKQIDTNSDIFSLKDNDSILVGINNYDSTELFKNEINSSLYLKPIFLAAKKVLPDLKKIYYKSKNKFIFVSPGMNINNNKELTFRYTCPSWIDSINKIDSYKQFIITKAYINNVSKEKLITLSLPIYKNKDFLGIVSIDIKLDTLVSYINKIPLKGNIYIIDENNNSVASKFNEELNKKNQFNKSFLIKKEIVENQLYIAYPLNEKKIREEAFYKSLGKIFILFLIFIISIILLYLKNLLIKVQNLANTDSLTNILNRRAMKEAIENQIKISRRYNQPLSFLLIDIDYFKKVNDNYGHQIGDLVLVEISKLFKQLIRACDIAGRYGGEEFLITLANTDINEAFIMAERLRKLINQIKIKNTDINLTVSIGCYFLKDEDDYDSILKNVDKLLYKAKNEGRDQTVKEDLDVI
ncbi:diguanylate cyclase [Halarcobacter sp.]|uniref:sensor domain-containing diguanylate cyclase n=1 Tax=Halarcobacter sp. TaxID=2321133 RepID=UPI0029F58A04|nr:diguanylate cyclase [Halarcobacter sp.]